MCKLCILFWQKHMLKDYLVQLRNKLFGVNAIREELKALKEELKASNIILYNKNILTTYPKDSIKELEISSTNGELKESNSELYKTFIQDQSKYPDKFNSTIDERDEMYLYLFNNYGNKAQAILEYFASGKQGFNIIKQICQWHFNDFDNITSFLDFASGYGRLTRFLVQEIPPNKIWICDIYKDAVQFQKEQFGVHGINSVHIPTELKIEMKYDCIFVGSLFSHLPSETFVEWLSKLYNLLSPHGILIFSVHDSALLANDLKIGEEGFLFLRLSESGSLDKSEYGTMYVNESFVSKVVERVTGNSIFFRKPKGLWSLQDLYIISKNPSQQFDTLDISAGPLGCLDKCYLSQEKDIIFEGWAAEPDELLQLVDIQLLINNQLVCHFLPCHNRLDVAKAYQNDNFLKSGFRCCVKQKEFNDDLSDIVFIKATNSKQIEKILKIDTLKSLLAR